MGTIITSLDTIVTESINSSYSDSVIKSKYEANADTNAFTDSYVSKVDSIEANATTDQTDVEISALMKDYTESMTNKELIDPSNRIHADRVDLQAKNTSGVLIPAGSPVTFTEVNAGDNYEVVLTDHATMVAGAVTSEEIAADALGVVVLNGRCPMDTDAYAEGTILYVNGGTLTDVEPTTGYSQPIAMVLRDAVDGIVQVLATYPKQSSDDVRYTASGTHTLTGVMSTEDAIEAIDARVKVNDSKVTNVPTALSIGTVSAVVVNISSDGGVDDVTIPQVVADTAAGVMSGADKAILDNLNNGEW